MSRTFKVGDRVRAVAEMPNPRDGWFFGLEGRVGEVVYVSDHTTLGVDFGEVISGNSHRDSAGAIAKTHNLDGRIKTMTARYMRANEIEPLAVDAEETV